MSLKQEMEAVKEQLKVRQEAKIDRVLPILISSGAVEIGVYGSFARGDYKATSDVDLYVLYESIPNKVLKGELYEAAYELDIDLLICEQKQFYESTSVFTKNVMKDRKILWKQGEIDEE